jgi:hypothetical protein
MFNPGQQIELVYPTITHILHVEKAPRKLRQLYVHRVRDLVAEPLTPNEYLHRPYVARSRWLILASELAAQPPKQFYAGTADNYRAPGILRLALYEPESTRPRQLLGRQINPTPHDRRLLLRWINKVADKYPDFELRILAPDLAVKAVS